MRIRNSQPLVAPYFQEAVEGCRMASRCGHSCRTWMPIRFQSALSYLMGIGVILFSNLIQAQRTTLVPIHINALINRAFSIQNGWLPVMRQRVFPGLTAG